jgi:two-component system, sensor histidine kinase YesM
MQKKIFIRFVIIVVIPSAILLFAATRWFINYSTNKQIETTTQLIDEMRKNLDTKLNYYRQMSMQVYLNGAAMAEIAGERPLEECGQIRLLLDSFVNSNRLISNAYLFTKRGYLFSGLGMLDMARVDSELQNDLAPLDGRMLWSPSRWMKGLYGFEQYYFFGSRHIRQNHEIIATLHFGFNELFFSDFFENTPFNSGQSIYVCASDGRVIASNGSMKPGTVLFPRKTMEGIVSGRRPYVDNGSSPKGRLVVASLSHESNWVILLVLAPNFISRELVMIENMFYLIVVFYLAFFFYVSFLLSKQLTKPLSDLTWALNQVSGGSLDIQVDENQIAEIKQLSRSFNAMTARVRTLIAEAKAEEKAKHRVQMQNYRLQLTPHFLYNSLNTIRWMAQINGQNNIKEISKALISFLKTVSDIGTEMITIREELVLLGDYATIQRYRYRDFRIVQYIPEELKDLYINKMILINLLENSIIHGFNELSGEGVVTITMRGDGSDLRIEFADNGCGFDPAGAFGPAGPSGQDATSGPSDAHNHSGLRNIRERLELYYGSSYRLDVSSSRGNGCTVTLEFPRIAEPFEL